MNRNCFVSPIKSALKKQFLFELFPFRSEFLKTHQLIQTELGEHYLFNLCPAHQIELAIKDAFKQSDLYNNCNKDYVNVYYLFKKANLCWTQFKCQAQFQGIEYIKYNRPTGTQWVEHQAAALKSHIHNFPVFIEFCNNQITNPHNNQTKKIMAKLTDFKNDIGETACLVFEAVRIYVGVLQK